MPGAPSEMCPEWFPLLEAANYLHVPPWRLLGIPTDEDDPPRCWFNWAWEAVCAKTAAQSERMSKMFGG